MEVRVREGVGDLAESMLQATPPDQAYLGLERWWRKRAA
jgi:hypothetical protein